MDLEGTMLSQVKTNTVRFHLYVDSKKQNKWKHIAKRKQSYEYREQIGGCQKGGK